MNENYDLEYSNLEEFDKDFDFRDFELALTREVNPLKIKIGNSILELGGSINNVKEVS